MAAMTSRQDPTARALRAVARHRALGLHFLGHYLGIEGLPDRSDGATRLVLRRLTDADDLVGHVELGVLVDLAMGQAVCARLAQGMRLATSSLVMHVSPIPARRPVEAHASVDWLEDRAGGGSAAVRFDVVDADQRTVATGSGSFVTIAAGDDTNVAIVDWSREVPDSLPSRAELTPNEAAVVAAIEATASRGAETVDGLVDLSWDRIAGPTTQPTLTGRLLVGAQHENRVGDLQGGLVFGVGAIAASRLCEGRRRVVDGQVLYLRPAGHGLLDITATLLRRGRRMAFVRVVLESGGKQSAELAYTLGPETPA